MSTLRVGSGVFFALVTLSSHSLLAQSEPARFEAAASLAVANTSEFAATEVGFGGRFGWRALSVLGFEAEMTHYPGDYPEGVAFSRARWEGFFGTTVGPQLGSLRLFARVRPGFLSYREAPEPFACIAIFPPPLACTLASGRTVLAIDVGGGVDVDVSERGFVRVDVGDRLLRYEGPVFDINRRRQTDSFWSHGLRVTVGTGLRF